MSMQSLSLRGARAALGLALAALVACASPTAERTAPTAGSAPVAPAATRAAPASAAPAARAPALPAEQVGALYAAHCASCHGEQRLGAMGPALLPENLGRVKPDAVRAAIAQGRTATQMPAFAATLSGEQIDALSRFVLTPPATPPSWTETDIRASHRILADVAPPLKKPAFATPDPLNLFIVVELGDHHATLFDGTRLAPITRFATRPNLHGGPKFSPDGRFVYFASRDGWLAKYDIWMQRMVAEVRVAINTRNAAVSSDGRWVIAGNHLPHSVVILDARDLTLVKALPVASRSGASSRVSAVYDAAPRQSFVVALKDVPELWEIPYGAAKAPSSEAPDWAPRQVPLSDVLDDFFFDGAYAHVIGASREGGQGRVVRLSDGADVARLALDGMPHLGSGITWQRGGHTLMATPNLKKSAVSIIDMGDWHTVAEVPTPGPGFFIRSHEQTPYAWTDTFHAQPGDTLVLIDKQTLQVAKTLTPSPGKTAAHTEFTRDGRYALVSVWDSDGALVIYDAKTLQEVKRFAMNKPSGKYNVYNKVTRSSGTSH